MPSYEQSCQLHHLRNQDFLEYSKMVALLVSGASLREVETQIDAFEDMNECNQKSTDEVTLKAEKFSFFLELQRPKVKNAIYEAGFDLGDFAEWLRDGRFSSDSQVRDLRRVLPDPTARETFLSGGAGSIGSAVSLIESRRNLQGENLKGPLALRQLARGLIKEMNDLKFSEIVAMKSDSDGVPAEGIRALRELDSQLKSLLQIFAE